jgi:5'(3')-deoxyribonucleotidase
MRIGIDMDGVLARFDADYAHLITALYPEYSFPVNDPNWPSSYYWERAAGLTPEEEACAWRVINSSKSGFWEHLSEYPETRRAVQELRDMRLAGDDLYFITVRPSLTAKLQTERWLMAKGLISPSVLIASGGKGLLAAGLHLDAFIDDKPEFCDEVLIARPLAAVYMVTRPYNREHKNPGVIRVKDVVEALKLIQAKECAA